MRLISFLIFGFLMSGSAYAAYDSTWYQTEYWSGEWPNGFSVARPGVHLPGRAAMDKDLKPTVNCEMPYKAVFNPWNDKGNPLRDAHYFTASKIVHLKAKRTFIFQEDAPKSKPIRILKGQVIEYLIYGAEGYFTIRIHGKEYSANQDLFKRFAKVPDTAFEEEQWLRLKCVGGETAWIYTKDLYSIDKDGINHYVVGLWNASIGDPGIDGYGEARDLTDSEIQKGGH